LAHDISQLNRSILLTTISQEIRQEKLKKMKLSFILMSLVGAFGHLPPAYLSVAGWQEMG
jgi:hypothetical protein